VLLKGHVGDVLDVKFFPSGEVSDDSHTHTWLRHAVQLTPVHANAIRDFETLIITIRRVVTNLRCRSFSPPHPISPFAYSDSTGQIPGL
jgi:hypothetical protein